MLPQCSHMTRKRGVYYYRRRLPHPHKGELALSLLTRRYREAEHLAALLDHTFSSVTKRMSDSPNLRAILRDHLKQQLDDDLEQHLSVPPGRPVYAGYVEEHQDPIDADLDVIDDLLSSAKEA